jgi:CubicO group peptidase (beta-lactamase class C family)
MGWQSDVEAVIDRFFKDKNLERDIPGVAVSVARDGEILTSGYSFADRLNRRIVDADDAIFHAGTLSGLFTVTAVMQLVERGLVNLADDVNKYTGDVRVENPFPAPIRVGDLLTHTSGFGERTQNAYARLKFDILPLSKLLRQELPRPVVAPGKMIIFSTWNLALAGHIVEQVSGLPFAQYVQDNIFAPLGMTSSTFNPVLPDTLVRRYVATYYDEGGALKPMPFLYATAAPAEGLAASVGDMARFMLALLNRGELDGARVLQAATVEEMFCPRHANHKLLPGATYGFVEYMENGKHGLVCEGVGLGVRGRLFLIPEGNTGLCILANATGLDISEGLTSEFVRQFYHIDMPQPKPPANFTVSADRFVGQYQFMGNDTHTVAKVRGLSSGVVQLLNNNDGTLTLLPLSPDDGRGGFIRKTKLVQADESLVYSRHDNAGRVAFEEGEGGLIKYLHAGSGLLSSYRRLPPQETPAVLLGLLGLCLAFFASGVVLWLFGLAATPGLSGTEAFGGLVGGLLSAVNLVFGAGAYRYVTARRWGLPAAMVAHKIPRFVRYLFGLIIPSIILTFAVVLIAVLAFQYEYWDALARLHYLGLAALTVVFQWVVNKLNLYYTRL